MMTAHSQTINPTSLSPTLSPVPDEDDDDDEDDNDIKVEAAAATAPAHPVPSLKASPDLTQHPAAMLCPDLQCQSAEASRAWTAARQPLPLPLAALFSRAIFLSLASTLITATSLCRRPLTQIAMSLKAGFSLRPSPALLTTIVWLVTTPSPSRRRRTLTLTTSSTTKTITLPTSATGVASRSSRRPSQTLTLRHKLLRKILTCSPMLARPLSDATMAALRLVRSEEILDVARVGAGEGAVGSFAQPLPEPQLLPHWPSGTPLPSREVLLTLLWAIKVEEKRGFVGKSPSPPQPGPSSLQNITAPPPSIQNHNNKRSWGAVGAEERHAVMSGKRRRFS